MITLDTAVAFVIYLVVAGIVFGLLFWLLSYCEREFPGASVFFKVGRVILVILAVLVLIGIIMSFAGHPIIVTHHGGS